MMMMMMMMMLTNEKALVVRGTVVRGRVLATIPLVVVVVVANLIDEQVEDYFVFATLANIVAHVCSTRPLDSQHALI